MGRRVGLRVACAHYVRCPVDAVTNDMGEDAGFDIIQLQELHHFSLGFVEGLPKVVK